MADQKWWLYILETVYGQLYTGITTDVERRLKEHTLGAPRGARALRGKAPLQLRYCRLIGDKGQALRLEYAVKRLPRTRKMALVTGEIAFEDAVTRR